MSLLVLFLALVISGTQTPSVVAVDVNITFDVNGIDSDASSTIITIDSTDYAYTDFPLSAFVWAVDSEHTVNVPVVSAGAGKQYVWLSWTNGDGLSGSSGTYTTPGSDTTVTVNYKTQYQVTYAVFGCSGLSVTPPVDEWADSGSPGSSLVDGFTAQVTDTGTRCNFVSDDRPDSITVPATVTGTYQTQYLLTIETTGLSSSYPANVLLDGAIAGSAYDGLPFTQWFDASATTGTIGVDGTVSGPTGTRYIFTEWDEDASTDNPRASVTMDGPKTFTAVYETQYYVTVTSLHGSPTSSDWVDSGDDYPTSVTSPDDVYVCDGYKIDGGGLTTGTSYTFAAVDAPHEIEYVWHSTVVTITITSDPAGSGYVKVDDVAIVTPHDFTWAIGDTHTLEALSPVSGSTGVQYVWTSWSDTGSRTHTYTVPGTSDTVTANYKTQYLLDIKTNGLASPSYRTKFYLDGRNVGTAYDGLDFTRWFDEGAATGSIGVDGTVSGATGTRYIFTEWDEDASTDNPRASVTMDEPKTFTAVYTTQYKLTMVTNFGTTDPSAGDYWYDPGSTVTISATAPTPGAGEKYVWNGWTGSGDDSYTGDLNPADDAVTMNGPVTETASWIRQCEVTFRSMGIGDDTTGTVVTVNGHAKTEEDLPYIAWYDWGSTISYMYSDPVPAATGKQYVWLSTSGLGQSGKSGGFTVTATGTVTATYKTQYSISFDSSGIGPDAATAIVVAVNNVNYQLRQLPYTAWYDSGSTISYAFSSTVSVVSGVQYAWTSTSGLSQTGRTGSFTASASGIVTGTYTSGYAAEITAASEAPNPAAQGSRITFTASVKNTGTTSMASVQVKIKVYTPDATLAATLSGVISSLGAGQTKSVGPLYYSLSPTAATGIWKYDVEVYYGVSLLASKTANTFTVNSPVTAAEIAAVSVNPNPSPQGSKLTFAVTVHNAGTVNLAVVTVRLSIYKPGGALAASPSGTISGLTAGGADKTAQIYYMTTTTAPTGTWTYDVKVYYGTTLLDSETSLEFEVEARTIAGAINSVEDAPDPVSRGGKVTFTVEVENTGNVAWSGIIKVKIFSPDGRLVSAPQYATVTVQPGDTYTCNELTWSVPLTAATGSYTYTVSLVYGSTILDSESGLTIEVTSAP